MYWEKYVLNIYVHNTQKHSWIPVNTYKAFGQVLFLIFILTESNLQWLSCHTLIIFWKILMKLQNSPREQKKLSIYLAENKRQTSFMCWQNKPLPGRELNFRRKSPDRQHGPVPTQYILVDPTYRWDRRGAADPLSRLCIRSCSIPLTSDLPSPLSQVSIALLTSPSLLSLDVNSKAIALQTKSLQKITLEQVTGHLYMHG